ncbi:MAG: flagellar hook-associated protein FlgL [Planctomycetaceae bacterium]|nr:flagellar hook-associated protein FlgL [Planctomycetaceae bacterium]
MPVGPILPGRVPSSLLATRLQQDLFRNTKLLNQLQDQVATGQKIFLPSDAPAAAVRSLVLQRQLEYQEQYKVSIQTDRSFLSVSEQSLQSVSDLLNHAKSLLLEGVGDSVSSTERIALADEVSAAIKGAVITANSSHRGRFLFGGSQSDRPPFEIQSNNTVVYRGDGLSIDTLIEQHLNLSNNVAGTTAFGVLRSLPSQLLNPGISLSTSIADLHQGSGINLGAVQVTLQDGATIQQANVDLTSASTVGDIKTRLEQAFAGGPLTLTVDIDPATNSGLRLTPSSGTVGVTDISGSRVAVDLGISSVQVATILGGDLNPRLTEQTLLSDLNGGTGIGPSAGTGLQITVGENVQTIDLSAAVTVEDALNAIRLTGLDLDVGINAEGTALSISSRVSGVDFSVGENNGNTATLLGIRTLTGETQLSSLNHGLGVPVDAQPPFEITRRDGSIVQVDLSNAQTVQDVLDAINAVDPGILVASFNLVGNGISLVDNDGVSTGPLIVTENAISSALGLNGEESGVDPTVPLVGQDPNPQEDGGLFNILSRLEKALRTGDNQELTRLDGLLNTEIDRFNLVRGDIGNRLKVLDEVESRILDRDVLIQESLSVDFDTDITETITQVAQIQSALEATLRIAAQTSQLSILAFL